MDIKTHIIEVYGKSCVGCQRNKSDVMLSADYAGGFVDIFLTTDQARALASELLQRLAENASDEG